MQSVFRLPWSSDNPGAKIMENATLHKSRPMPVVEIPQQFMNKLKRKPTDSPESAPAQHGHVLKKWKGPNGEVKAAVVANGASAVAVEAQRPALVEQPSNAASASVLEARPKAQPSRRESTTQSKSLKAQKPAVKLEPLDPVSTSGPTPVMAADVSRAQQAIEAQFNYEILLKHNELRLIEQELAKCQVALEQLRRCSLIPYPGMDCPSLDVSNGIGPALQPPSGYTEPQHAAPWGVTDGPYTRHYAKWLIPDPKFDPMPERLLAQQSQGYFGVGEGRTTRGSFAEFGSTGKARTSRTSTGTLKLQVLGENPPPAPKVDPLLHKRSTDGQLVRLFCSQCGHSNFSNTQGFLNHCRIKHNQVFKSHDQAAIACGVPVDKDAEGNPVSATEPPSVAATTPAAVSFPAPAVPGSVHPLIRANPSEWAKDVHRDFNKSPSEPSATTTTVPRSEFAKAPSTPHLNSLLAKKGFEGDFKGLVDMAKTKVDISSIESSDDDRADSAIQTPVSAKPAEQLVRVPSGPAATAACKVSAPRPANKGQSTGSGRVSHIPSPVQVGESAGSPPELSPHPAESNPGLVSDNDDDDDEDGYDARSQTDIIMDDTFVVEDASDMEGDGRAGSRKGLEKCFARGEGSRKH